MRALDSSAVLIRRIFFTSLVVFLTGCGQSNSIFARPDSKSVASGDSTPVDSSPSLSDRRSTMEMPISILFEEIKRQAVDDKIVIEGVEFEGAASFLEDSSKTFEYLDAEFGTLGDFLGSRGIDWQDLEYDNTDAMKAATTENLIALSDIVSGPEFQDIRNALRNPSEEIEEEGSNGTFMQLQSGGSRFGCSFGGKLSTALVASGAAGMTRFCPAVVAAAAATAPEGGIGGAVPALPCAASVVAEVAGWAGESAVEAWCGDGASSAASARRLQQTRAAERRTGYPVGRPLYRPRGAAFLQNN